MDNEEFFDRIGGHQINLDPEESDLAEGTILIKLNDRPYSTWLRKLKNLMDDSVAEYQKEDAPIIKNPLAQEHDLALVMPAKLQDPDDQPRDKTLIVGTIYLTYKYLNKMLLTFSQYDPVIYQYANGSFQPIEKRNLLDTIEIEMGGDTYGVN